MTRIFQILNMSFKISFLVENDSQEFCFSENFDGRFVKSDFRIWKRIAHSIKMDTLRFACRKSEAIYFSPVLNFVYTELELSLNSSKRFSNCVQCKIIICGWEPRESTSGSLAPPVPCSLSTWKSLSGGRNISSRTTSRPCLTASESSIRCKVGIAEHALAL